MRRACLRLVQLIDASNRRVGQTVRWLVLVIPLITVCYGTVRRLTPWGHNGVSELQWFMFAWVFLVGAGYTLLRDEHVRVDLLRDALSTRWRHRIDIALHAVLVVPGCAYLAWNCWFFWTHSLVTPDGPEDVLTGLQRWPLKLALFAGFLLLGLQSLAEIIRRVAWLQGWSLADKGNEHDRDRLHGPPDVRADGLAAAVRLSGGAGPAGPWLPFPGRGHSGRPFPLGLCV